MARGNGKNHDDSAGQKYSPAPANRGGKINNYPRQYNDNLTDGGLETPPPAVFLDCPWVEDVFTQDLTNPVPNYTKKGFRPTWSRYTRFTEVNETRPGVYEEARALADEEWQDDENDYRDPTAFTSYPK
jgi:hypothetical protein